MSKTTNKKTRYLHWRAASLNCRNASDDFRMTQILQTASQAKINILSMQEVIRTGKDSRSYDIFNDTREERWEVYWSGNDHKKTEGVAIAIKASPILQIERVHQENSRGMYMDVNYGGLKQSTKPLCTNRTRHATCKTQILQKWPKR